MIAHHEQAIEMAEIALDPNTGASAEVVDLATRIQAAQDPEVELMTGWLTAAGESVTMDTSDGHDMSSMDGMMTADQMDAMAAMTGAEFDQMWLEMMIAHHEGADQPIRDRQGRRIERRRARSSPTRSSPPSRPRSPRCRPCSRADDSSCRAGGPPRSTTL